MTNMKYLQVFSHIITCLVEGEFMQMEDVYRIDQGIERYMTKTRKENRQTLWKAVWSLVVS